MSAFPKRITFDLATFHQDGLAEIAEHLHLRDVQELVSVVISRGIVEMLGSPTLQHSSGNVVENVQGAPKVASTTERTAPGTSGPAPFGMKRSLDELHVQEAERDREMAKMKRDLGLAETPEGVHALGRQVESYIGVPLSEGLRHGLEAVVNAYPNLAEENLYCALLEIGLKKVREDPKALAPSAVAQKAKARLSSKEASQQHRAEWKALCRNVARGWR